MRGTAALRVMDLHKELNRLQQQLATDQIGGALLLRDPRPATVL